MTDTIKIPEGYTRRDNADGSIVFTPIETRLKFWMPDEGERYITIYGYGRTATCFNADINWLSESNKHHNIFKTSKDAEDVAQYQRVFNAVCRAVKQVSPDYVPVWDGETNNWFSAWDGKRWFSTCNKCTHTIFPPVESRAKCEEVIALLNAEGIVPVNATY